MYVWYVCTLYRYHTGEFSRCSTSVECMFSYPDHLFIFLVESSWVREYIPDYVYIYFEQRECISRVPTHITYYVSVSNRLRLIYILYTPIILDPSFFFFLFFLFGALLSFSSLLFSSLLFLSFPFHSIPFLSFFLYTLHNFRSSECMHVYVLGRKALVKIATYAHCKH